MDTEITFNDALSLTISGVIEIFKRWAFDERDFTPDVDEILKEHLKRSLTGKEKKGFRYINLKRNTAKVTDAANELAYQNRICNQVDIAKANLKYQKALRKLE